MGDADDDIVIRGGIARIAGGARQLPGDAGEVSGDGEEGGVGEAEEEGALVDSAGGEVAEDGGAEEGGGVGGWVGEGGARRQQRKRPLESWRRRIARRVGVRVRVEGEGGRARWLSLRAAAQNKNHVEHHSRKGAEGLR